MPTNPKSAPPCGHAYPAGLACGEAQCDREIRAERAQGDRWADPVAYGFGRDFNPRQIRLLVHRGLSFHQVAAWYNVPTWLVVGVMANPTALGRTIHLNVEQAVEALYGFRGDEPVWSIADRTGLDDETLRTFRERLQFAAPVDGNQRPGELTDSTNYHAA